MPLTFVALSVQVLQTRQGLKVENAHYVAEISRERGGLISRLLLKRTGEVLLENMHIYTDYGIYGPGKRYVGTRNEAEPKLTVRKGKGEALVESEGRLKPSPPGRAIAYKARFTFDESPEIKVSCELLPNFGEEEVRAFLALCWTIPALSEWALRSPEGWLCQDRGDGSRRDFMGLLDPERPVAVFLTQKGAHLIVKDVRWETPTPPQRVVVHGWAFFLCFYDGAPAPLVRGRYRVDLALRLGTGIPTLDILEGR